MDAERKFLWSVPESWSLEEAASVPVVYATAYYALVVRGGVRPGDKVLIHSGEYRSVLALRQNVIKMCVMSLEKSGLKSFYPRTRF